MEKYIFIDDITSDVVFEAYGKSLEELFSNAAEALFSMICKIEKIDPKEKRTAEISAESPDKLLIKWLQHLIADVDIEEMFYSKFRITEISDTKLKAELFGESISPEKGETVVKAVTYHQFEFKKTDEGYMCRVAVDI